MSLEISHLVVNGCSFTYCQGLDYPSKQGWPALLAKKLNVPVVNLGIKGSGNHAILRRTIEYFYQDKSYNSKPFYIIAFSQAMRREEYIKKYRNQPVDNFYNLSTFGDEPIERAIFEHIDEKGEYYMELRKLIYWLSIVNLFKANNIPYFTTNYMSDHDSSIELLKLHYKNLYDEINNDEFRVKDFFKLGTNFEKLPCGHESFEAQQVVADYCYNTMIEKYGNIIPVKTNYCTLKDYAYGQPDDYFNHGLWGYNNEWLKDKPVV